MPQDPSEPPPEEPPVQSTASTASTAETGTPPQPDLLYPPAPYDCTAGVPPGTPEARQIRDVETTEGLAFDLLGHLVTEGPSDGKMLQWTYEGEVQLLSEGIGSARGLNLLNNGDVLIASGSSAELWGVDMGSGAPYPVAVLPVSDATPGARAPAEVDVASDGTMVVGTLYGLALAVAADGTAQELGEVGEWGMGAAFSVDESRAYFSRWDVDEPEIWTAERLPDGQWSELTLWATVPSSGTLSGLAVDACDHVYAVDEDCVVYRVTPDGDSSVLVRLKDSLPRFAECRTIVFGRGLGGWDAYHLYASTYDEVAEIAVGVPGRPR